MNSADLSKASMNKPQATTFAYEEKKLTRSLLIQLLQHDDELQQVLKHVVANKAANKETWVDQESVNDLPLLAVADKLPDVAPEPACSLKDELTEELRLLDQLKQDSELAQTLINDESEGQQLIRLAVLCSDWDQVLELWDRFATRCKSEQRAVSDEELAILNGILYLHNKRWDDASAMLVSCDIGVSYDYRLHERGTPQGDSVMEVWLPALVNAAGQTQKKNLVKLK